MKIKTAVQLLFLFPLFNVANAELTVERLVEQAHLTEGATPVNESDRWRGARKIIIWDRGFDHAKFQVPDHVELVFAESLPEAVQHAADADALLGFCNPELIAAAPKLVWVQIYWAGAERCLSVPDVGSGQIVMSNMQKMSSPAIAEHAVAMAMALSRQLPQFSRLMESKTWAGDNADVIGRMRPIAGRTMLVVGLGGIGSEVARLADALGMQVWGTRNSSREGPDYVDYVGLADELHALAAKADVIVNALPLTASTTKLLDESFFNAAKEGAIFVNVGRGQTVDTAALIAALDSGRISGAGLDVTSPEPLPADHALWSYENVVITPHVAGSGGERERHEVLLLENLRRYIAGERLLNVVDPEKGY